MAWIFLDIDESPSTGAALMPILSSRCPDSGAFRRILIAGVTAAGIFFAPAGIGAQSPGAAAARPRLELSRDTNSAADYYREGMNWLESEPRRAAGYFAHASRIDPEWADALYAQRIALLLIDRRRLQRYLDGHPGTLESAPILQIDSLFIRALWRNPFLYRKLDEQLLRRARRIHDPAVALVLDPVSRGWKAYWNGDLWLTVGLWKVVLERFPDRAHLRAQRSLVFAAMQNYDSAAVEMSRAIADLHKSDTSRTNPLYQSKALYEYSLGRMYVQSGKLDSARAAFERALVEDFSFHAAHAWLGSVAAGQGDTPGALRSYELALELAPDNAPLRYEYGATLLDAGRFDDAKSQFEAAIRLSPLYVKPYLALGSTLELLGRDAEAMARYRDFLARAPRSAEVTSGRIQEKIAELSEGPGSAQPR